MAGLLKNFFKRIYPLRNLIIALLSLIKHLWRLFLIFMTLGLVGIIVGSILIIRQLPDVSLLSSKPIPLTTHIRDRHGTVLYKIYDSQNRSLVSLSELPTSLIQAIISAEDKTFFTHHGVSLSGTLRALIQNFKCSLKSRNQNPSNCFLQGGSTITQQLVKISLLTPERTIKRKVQEVFLSLLAENRYSKEEILQMYLNRVGFGGSAYGIEEASLTYFGKPASQLSLSQSALLAGLPASPTTYSPFGNNPQKAFLRQKEVLNLMVQNQYITSDQAQVALSEDLNFTTPKTDILAPHFVMYVREYLVEKYGEELVNQGGLDVITTLDLNTQKEAENILSSELEKIKYLKVQNGSVLVTRPQSGEIIAMVGSKDYFDLKNDGNVNVTLRPRQPGSAIKPINYALAFTKGFTPASLIDDSPVTYKIAGQPNYSPVNYDRRFHGKIPLRVALASSYNVPAVKVLAANGVSNMVILGQQMGITTWEDSSRFGLSLTLGGGEVTMFDLSTAYGVFANYGQKINLNPLLEVKDHQGKILDKYICPPPSDTSEFPSAFSQILANYSPSLTLPQTTQSQICESQSVLSPEIAYQIIDILKDNQARTPTFGPNSKLVIPGHEVAVKTGTTNNLRDNWTIGFSPEYLVAVWVGNNNNAPMSYVASGVTGATPIWQKVMQSLLKSTPPKTFPVPPNLIKVSICPTTGTLSCSGCPGKMEYFLPGTEPKNSCNFIPPPTNSDRILEGANTFRN